MSQIPEVIDFLACATPVQWLEEAARQPELLLIDHAHCEKKAASTAMNLLFRYVDRPELLEKQSQLAREELLHFEQVLGMMQQRGIHYQHLTPSRYAGELRQMVSTHEPQRLIDILIVGAFIEARSCERFEKLIPWVDEELGKYYRFLLKSESRHFEDYLNLAKLYAEGDISERIAEFAAKEQELIESVDTEFRFHSGVPA